MSRLVQGSPSLRRPGPAGGVEGRPCGIECHQGGWCAAILGGPSLSPRGFTFISRGVPIPAILPPRKAGGGAPLFLVRDGTDFGEGKSFSPLDEVSSWPGRITLTFDGEHGVYIYIPFRLCTTSLHRVEWPGLRWPRQWRLYESFAVSFIS